jgi:hypothetical protein
VRSGSKRRRAQCSSGGLTAPRTLYGQRIHLQARSSASERKNVGSDHERDIEPALLRRSAVPPSSLLPLKQLLHIQPALSLVCDEHLARNAGELALRRLLALPDAPTTQGCPVGGPCSLCLPHGPEWQQCSRSSAPARLPHTRIVPPTSKGMHGRQPTAPQASSHSVAADLNRRGLRTHPLDRSGHVKGRTNDCVCEHTHHVPACRSRFLLVLAGRSMRGRTQ